MNCRDKKYECPKCGEHNLSWTSFYFNRRGINNKRVCKECHLEAVKGTPRRGGRLWKKKISDGVKRSLIKSGWTPKIKVKKERVKAVPKSCPSCGGCISESAFYAGGICRTCWDNIPAKGRTPNTKCSYCGVPLYKQPNVLKKKSTFACLNCKNYAASQRMKNNPKSYENMVKKAKATKGTHRFPEKYICPDCGGKKSHTGKVCKKCYGKYLAGENSPTWKGGLTSKNRLERTKFALTVGREVLKRDNYTCQMCGTKDKYFHADHIQSWADHPDLRFDINNCRTLCVDCHYFVTFGRKPPKNSRWGIYPQMYKKIEEKLGKQTI